MSRSYSETLRFVDGDHVFTPGNNSENTHQLTIKFSPSAPVDSTITVSAKPRNLDEFFPISKIQEFDATLPIFVEFNGDVQEYKIALAGFSGVGEIIFTDNASNTPINSWYGAPSVNDLIEVSEDGGKGLAVYSQDQTTPPFDLYFVQERLPSVTVAIDVVVDDTSLVVSSSTGILVGDYIGVTCQCGDRYYFGEVIALPGGNTLDTDTPFDFEYDINDVVTINTRDLSVDGSTTTQEFKIVTVGSILTYDVTRVMVNMLTEGPVDLSLFGDLPKLSKGIVLRTVDGQTRNIFNVKDNGELATLCFDWDPSTSLNPAQGVDGVSFRYTFAGQDKHGVAIRLQEGKDLRLLIQDDLSLITRFRMVATGHEVQ